MNDNEELRDATDEWADALFPTGAPVQSETDHDEDDEGEADATGGDDGEAEGSGDLTEAEHEALSASFWASLSPADSAAAERSEATRDAMWRAYVAGAVASDEGSVPPSGVDVVAYVLENAANLVDEDGHPTTPAAWISAWSVASPTAWQEALRSWGWPATTEQPSARDTRAFGRGFETAVLGESFAAMVAKDRAAGRKW